MKKKNSAPLRRRTVVLAVGAALAALAATSALADPLLTIKLFRDSDVMFRDADMSRWADNYLELGAIYNSADSLRFGQFSGLTDQGAYANVGFNYISRDQANDAQYWQVHGANLGLDSRKFKAEGGIQGQWNASFSFDGLEKSQTDSARFHHQGLGSSTLTLPAGFTRRATSTPANFPNSQFREYDIQQGRDIYRIGLGTIINKEWDFKVNYREDKRDGTRLTGFAYSTGVASILPYEIDDKTQQVEAILAYTTREAQFQLAYTYSKFSNSLNAFNVQSPYSGSTLDNRMSLAPDNDYHQISATGAYNFSKTTRLSATYSYGKASQDQNFLPYSVNGTGGANTTGTLPRTSLDAEVVNTLFDVALTSKPIDKMNLKVAYQYRDSDNRTPINQYRYVGRDAALPPPADAGPAAAVSAAIRTNSPMSSTENKFILEGGYEIADRTVLRAGLEHTDKEYGNADRDDIRTDKLSIELRRPVSDEFIGSVGYTRTERQGSDYDKNVYFRETYTGVRANGTATFASQNGLTNNPSMRSYIWADFDEDRVRTSGNWTVDETLSLQGVVDGYQQKMRGPDCNRFNTANEQRAITAPLADTCLGRKEADGASVSLDLQYQPAENLTTFAFGNFAQTEYKQIGRTWQGVNTAVPPGTFLGNTSGALNARNWYGDITATDYTAGFGLKWQPMEKWDVGGTYVFNYGKGKSDIDQAASPAAGAAGAIVASTSMPDTWSKLHSVQLFAKWDYSDQLSWRFNYLYENLKSSDWATSGLGTSVPLVTQVVFTGQDAPRYSNHVFGVSAVIRKW